MTKRTYKYTSGRPRTISVIIAFILVVIFCTYAFLPGYDNPTSWALTLVLYSPVFILFVIIGIGLAIKYLVRILYLRRQKSHVPVVHYLVVFLAVLLALSPIWTYVLADSRVSTHMNTVEDFKKLADSCKLDSVRSYYNGGYHRATDAEAYISVQPEGLYYPIYEKDKLREIYDAAGQEKCQNYLKHREHPIWDATHIQYEQW